MAAGEQQGDRLALHRRAAIGMERELARLDLLLGVGRGDQLAREHFGLARGDHPADDVAAEHVEDHVQIKVRPFARAV